MTIDVVGRAREIGIMKVVGAKNGSVIKLLLLESVIMDGIGGCTGIVIGIALSYVVISLMLRFSTSTLFLGFPRRSFVIPITSLNTGYNTVSRKTSASVRYSCKRYRGCLPSL
jgi:putative ABC transport system permease protein